MTALRRWIQQDQVNSYLPTERRVRRLSSRERADSWLGSEMTLDDFAGFSGRVLDYERSLLGEKSILAIADLKKVRRMFSASNLNGGR